MSWDQVSQQAIVAALHPASAAVLDTWFPCSRVLAGDALALAAQRFQAGVRDAEDSSFARATRWASCLEAIMAQASIEEPYARDVARYEGTIACMALDERIAAAARRSAGFSAVLAPLRPGRADRVVPVVGAHVRLVCFDHEVHGIVSAIEACDAIGALARPAACAVLFIAQAGETRPRLMRVNAGMARLIDLCDGHRSAAAIADRLQALAGETDPELPARTLLALDALARRDALELRSLDEAALEPR